MTAANPRPRTLLRPACVAGLAAVLALAGCKSKDGGGEGSGGGSGGRDPLVYGPNRIPRQDLPLPDRGGIGVKDRGDPLIGSPTGKAGDKTGVGYSDGPERFKGTHIPGVGTTPAALAGKAKDGEELKIDTPDNRVPLQPAGGIQPASPGGEEPGPTGGVDALFAELEKYGAKRADRSLARENGQYVFRTSMTGSNGAKRQYSGAGATATEAVQQVLDQVVADRK